MRNGLKPYVFVPYEMIKILLRRFTAIPFAPVLYQVVPNGKTLGGGVNIHPTNFYSVRSTFWVLPCWVSYQVYFLVLILEIVLDIWPASLNFT
ncbi:hypothetical protein HZS_4482 [Henneguya salminicola]|nr:hypothetical protein HZS_4482 [Henneguya salminicola]